MASKNLQKSPGSKERKLAYSDDPVLLKAYLTGKWPEMEWHEQWAAAHAIAARGGKNYGREKQVSWGDLD